MNKTEIIILDLTDCKYLGELHLRIKKAFDFPNYYGENWDAFWDLVREPRTKALVKIIGIKTVAKDLQPSIQIMLGILQENKEWHRKFNYIFDFTIAD